MIAEQHAVLDQLDVRAAQRLGIQIPNEPNADQKYWLQEMNDAEDEEFDRVFVDRLRAAHGKVFSAIAFVRAGTRNDLVRELAQQSPAASAGAGRWPGSRRRPHQERRQPHRHRAGPRRGAGRGHDHHVARDPSPIKFVVAHHM